VADLRLAIEVDVVAVVALTAAVLPGVPEAGWGRGVNVSSGLCQFPVQAERQDPAVRPSGPCTPCWRIASVLELILQNEVATKTAYAPQSDVYGRNVAL
jgi:NAD(P)-dependent dehydrogenase (short-subunit alcohol dehydrogenase family)